MEEKKVEIKSPVKLLFCATGTYTGYQGCGSYSLSCWIGVCIPNTDPDLGVKTALNYETKDEKIYFRIFFLMRRTLPVPCH